jgi:aspartate racemase
MAKRPFCLTSKKHMKIIGLIGGMSWESSIEYYRLINESVRARLGGLHSARSLMVSVDFAEVEAMQRQGRWDEAGELLIAAAQDLARAGAGCVVLCTNTMHKLAGVMQAQIDIPLLHIADPTAAAVKAQGLQRVGLLGTRFTMEEEFYRGRLVDQHGLAVSVPPAAERQTVHDVIYNELCLGEIRPASREALRAIVERLAAEHDIQGVILGCTELCLILKPEDCPVPVFDTTRLHALAAVDFALEAAPAAA